MDDDWIMWFSLAAGVGLALLATNLYRKFFKTKTTLNQGTEEQRPRDNEQLRPVGRHGPPAANNRRAATAARNRRIARRDDGSESDSPPERAPVPVHDDSDEEKDERTPFDSKVGAKKRAKLEAKEEKRQQRETEDRLREEKKVKEAKEEEERKKLEEQEQLDEKRQVEEAKRLRAEQLQREQDEYLKMKAAFTVEEEGCEVNESDEGDNLLEKFVEHIKEKKVILFEELATNFGLKVPDTIARINTLVAEGRLTGVMDDRGKFIYISEEELAKFAKFIKQRGRVSIFDLVENSSSIINITQETKLIPAVEV